MPSHDFDRRYRLLKVVAQGDGVRTHNAQELTTGRVVMVHIVDAAGPEQVEALQARLGRLTSADKVRVLETSTLPSGFAIVTEFLPGLRSFPEWLAARLSPGDAAETAEIFRASSSGPVLPQVRPADVSAASPRPRAGGGADTLAVVVPAAYAPETLAIPVDPAPAGAAPGAAAIASTPASVGRPPDTNPGLAEEDLPGAGEPPVALGFRIGGPDATSGPAVAGVSGASPRPGEFTRLFMTGGRVQTELGAIPTAVPTAPPLPAAPPAPPPAPPPALPSAPPAAPVSAPAAPLAPGEFTLMFQAPTPAPMGGASASPFVGPPSSHGSAPPPLSGPPPVSPVAFSPPPAPHAPRAAPPPFVAPPPAASGSATGALAARGAPEPPRADLNAFAAFAPPAAPPPAPSATPSFGLGGGSNSPAPGGNFPPPLMAPPVFGGPPPVSPANGAPSPFGLPSAPGSAGPSDYTRMIRQAVTPPPPPATPAPPPTPPPPPTPKRAIPLPLLVIGNAVLLAAVALVLYFILHAKPGSVAVPSAPALPAAGSAPPTTPTAGPTGAPPAAAPAPPR